MSEAVVPKWPVVSRTKSSVQHLASMNRTFCGRQADGWHVAPYLGSEVGCAVCNRVNREQGRRKRQEPFMTRSVRNVLMQDPRP